MPLTLEVITNEIDAQIYTATKRQLISSFGLLEMARYPGIRHVRTVDFTRDVWMMELPLALEAFATGGRLGLGIEPESLDCIEPSSTSEQPQ